MGRAASRLLLDDSETLFLDDISLRVWIKSSYAFVLKWRSSGSGSSTQAGPCSPCAEISMVTYLYVGDPQPMRTFMCILVLYGWGNVLIVPVVDRRREVCDTPGDYMVTKP